MSAGATSNLSKNVVTIKHFISVKNCILHSSTILLAPILYIALLFSQCQLPFTLHILLKTFFPLLFYITHYSTFFPGKHFTIHAHHSKVVSVFFLVLYFIFVYVIVGNDFYMFWVIVFRLFVLIFVFGGGHLDFVLFYVSVRNYLHSTLLTSLLFKFTSCIIMQLCDECSTFQKQLAPLYFGIFFIFFLYKIWIFKIKYIVHISHHLCNKDVLLMKTYFINKSVK